ncbi:MAG: 1-acyl-sn-glycerol-3-phosphate acyltransferase [Candidatus Hydrogenedentes bacterium]|nr:1-acyl-sn-glycerol-3-phosphate acyltransferase [Candidatus Hydrogenedentota bacterium]
MQNVVIDKPYQFVPPRHGRFWPAVMGAYAPAYLRKYHGVETFEFLGVERLKESLAAKHGVMLTPNHCRPCDPMVLGLMTARFSQPLYIMASWHLFMQGRLQPWLLPRMGVFSVYREGLDKDALKCAIQMLVEARRPLVLFPEGIVSRTNDRLNPLMDGAAFIARSAAKKRSDASPSGKVVIHPVAIRYFFCGDVENTIRPVLDDIEKRLSWQLQRDKPLVDRIVKVGDALLTLKELEYSEKPRPGALLERVAALIDQLLTPLEHEWLAGKRQTGVTARVKAIRAAIVPDMAAGSITEEERARRWRQLADVYLAQQAALYPADYFDDPPTPEQLLETVERFEEDLTDTARVHRPIHVRVEVGEAIEVSPNRERGVDTDPVMARVRTDLETMLARSKESRPGHATRGPADVYDGSAK